MQHDVIIAEAIQYGAVAGDYLAHNLPLGPPDFKTPLPP
jgi:hypothetical protein